MSFSPSMSLPQSLLNGIQSKRLSVTTAQMQPLYNIFSFATATKFIAEACDKSSIVSTTFGKAWVHGCGGHIAVHTEPGRWGKERGGKKCDLHNLQRFVSNDPLLSPRPHLLKVHMYKIVPPSGDWVFNHEPLGTCRVHVDSIYFLLTPPIWLLNFSCSQNWPYMLHSQMW